MSITIQFSIEADGTNLKMGTEMPSELPQDLTPAESAALDLADFLSRAAKIWLNSQEKTPAECKAGVENSITTRH